MQIEGLHRHVHHLGKETRRLLNMSDLPYRNKKSQLPMSQTEMTLQTNPKINYRILVILWLKGAQGKTLDDQDQPTTRAFPDCRSAGTKEPLKSNSPTVLATKSHEEFV